MSTIPAAGHISDALRTEGEVKADLEAVIASLRQVPGAASVELAATISGGSITPAGGGGIIVVDTESAAATDDLANIIPTNYPDNACILLRNANAARVVTLKHAATGTGQIFLDRSTDYVLDDTLKYLLLQRRGNDWYEVFRGPSRPSMPVVYKNDHFTVQKEDLGKVFTCFNAISVHLAAAASLGNGFFCSIVNINTASNTVSVEPNGSETIDDLTIRYLRNGDGVLIVCDGTEFFSVGGMEENFATQVSPSGATLTINANDGPYIEVAALTGDVTTFTINNDWVGKRMTLRFVQDATGGRTVAAPSGAKIAGSLASTASQASWLELIRSQSRWEGYWTQIPL